MPNDYYQRSYQTAQSQRGARPTRYTNFQQMFDANGDAARASAANVGNQASSAAQSAQGAANSLYGQFQQQMNSGSVVGLNGATGFTTIPGTTNVGPGSQATGSWAGYVDQMANGQYTGPGGLGDVAGSQGVYDRTNQAQQELNALGSTAGIQAFLQRLGSGGSTGATGLSAGLVGAAGRPGFDALQSQYNPNQYLTNLSTKAGTDAQAAMSGSAQNAAAWRQMLGLLQGVGGATSAGVGSPSTGISTVTPPPGPPAIPDSVTTVDQAVVDGYSPDQIIAKFGYAAWADSQTQAFGRGGN